VNRTLPGRQQARGRPSDPVTDAIVTRDLTKVFRHRRVGRSRPLTAVDRLNLRVHAGEIFGLLGPNGAGKTTTIGMLTTRVMPTTGQALVAGIDVRRHPAAVKQRIGVVPQSNTLDRSISVAENLYFHGRYFGLRDRQARQRSDELLERFRLTEKADALVDTLSGGMAQRLMVARAVLHEPDVLFLDEPTTGLDPQARIALWGLLRDLNAEGQTILLTTHYMEEADRLCHRLGIMNDGRILALGTPMGLKRSVDADTVVELTVAGELDGLAGHLAAVEGVSRVDTSGSAARVFAVAASGLLPRLLAIAERTGHEVTDVSVDRPNLETVFIAVTGKDVRK
jgi:ABC-2 type transport system ATP-binding protein